ncbi:MAG: prepilin-type N-terminal cleavage/methylation domain-containing protein [Kiritimatiellae bacterium]|nr:prepilin-type N-terminal cleavage/methylation domain-containing protein [Kiritimatiellia bacterium]
MKRGFTLLEVMIATIILSVGLVVLLTSFMNCQKVMGASQDFETAQYVLALGETAYPLPAPDQVTDDPFDNELLNIEEVSARELLDELDIRDMPREREQELEKYTFRREVDEVDDEELERSGYLYTVRTTVAWGGRRGANRSETTVLTLWRKKK